MGGSGRSLGSQLIADGFINERDLAATLTRQQNLEVVDLRQIVPDPAAAALMTESTARALNALPLSADENAIVIAVADPSPSVMKSLQEVIGRPVTVKVATQSDIAMAIGNSFRALANIDSHVEAFRARDSVHKEESTVGLAGVNEDAPVVQVVRLLITQGLRDRASDIHVEPQADRIRVRYRIDGALHDVLDLPGSMGPAIVSRIKILAGMNIVERRRPQDGQISLEIEGRAVDIRVATTSVVSGEKVVMRLLDKSRPIFRLGQLGMSPDVAQRYSALLHSPYGMVICFGPTGSGKTTTLYGSLSEINTPERNIMTIEDPVEYMIPSINQIQINEQAGITFAGGLKSILRQDPDVILVGEIRDAETARIAVQSALTGHFVLSSLHATDAVSALHRLLDMGVEAFLVASSITAVISQRLLRRVCDNCRESYEPSPRRWPWVKTTTTSQSSTLSSSSFWPGAPQTNRKALKARVSPADDTPLMASRPRQALQLPNTGQVCQQLRSTTFVEPGPPPRPEEQRRRSLNDGQPQAQPARPDVTCQGPYPDPDQGKVQHEHRGTGHRLDDNPQGRRARRRPERVLTRTGYGIGL
jgi:type IV pilus assembly protein PilB